MNEKPKPFDVGFHLGARRALEVLAEENLIDSNAVAWLLEEKYIKQIKEKDNK